MSQRPVLKQADRWFAALNTSVNASVTTWVLKASGATGLPTRTIVSSGSEKVLVTGIATDTPTAGLDSLTVERGYAGTTAAGHDADDSVFMLHTKDFHNESADRIAALEGFIVHEMGLSDGVIRDGLEVTAEGTPSMTVDVSAGAAVADGHPVALLTASTLTFTAPTTNPRIDTIYIDQYGAIRVAEGTEASSPSAPAVPAGGEGLATVTHTTAETSIKDSDDATNGFITDTRSFI